VGTGRVWLNAWRTLLGALDEEGLLKWDETFLEGSFAPAKKGARPSAKPGGARGRSGWYWSTVKVYRWEFGWKVPPPVKLSSMRLVEVTPDARLIEVGGEQHLSGRFKGGTSDTGESILSFVTEKGATFLVANEPAGLTADRDVRVSAYPVQPFPLTPKSFGQYLWIICPCSVQDRSEWRGRSRTGLSRR
jgi:hypothetical protein